MASKKTTKKQDSELSKDDTIDAKFVEIMPTDAEKAKKADMGQATLKGEGLKSRSYLILIFLGGLCVGAIGFGIAIVPDYFNQNDQLSSLFLDQKVTQDQIISLSEAVSEIRNIESSASFSEKLDLLRLSLSKLSSDISALRSAQQQELTTLKERIYLLENRPLSGEVSEKVIQSYEKQLSQLRAEIAVVANKPVSKLGQAQAEPKRLEVAARTTSRESVVASALVGIEVAISNGTGFSGLLEDLEAVLEMNLPEALSANAQRGVISLDKLQAEFPKLARVSLQAARREGDSTGFGAFFKAQLGFRSLSPREGTSPDAVLSRAEASVAAGNLQLALVELIDLPKSGQLVMQDWSKRAAARLSVLNALSELSRIMVVNQE